MKTYNFIYNVVLTFVLGMVMLDAVMVYCHFFNNTLGKTIIDIIDQIIY